MSGLGSGLTAEVIGGLSGIILGVLALLSVAPTVLMPSRWAISSRLLNTIRMHQHA